MSLPTITNARDAARYTQLCESGHMLVKRDTINGTLEMVLVSASGTPSAIVGKGCKYMFERFLRGSDNGKS